MPPSTSGPPAGDADSSPLAALGDASRQAAQLVAKLDMICASDPAAFQRDVDVDPFAADDSSVAEASAGAPSAPPREAEPTRAELPVATATPAPPTSVAACAAPPLGALSGRGPVLAARVAAGAKPGGGQSPEVAATAVPVHPASNRGAPWDGEFVADAAPAGRMPPVIIDEIAGMVPAAGAPTPPLLATAVGAGAAGSPWPGAPQQPPVVTAAAVGTAPGAGAVDFIPAFIPGSAPPPLGSA